MSAIKRTPADVAFSKCVRERAGYQCERCNAQHEENSMGLHCSHHIRRGNWSVRFDPDNAEALCYGCHSLIGGTEIRAIESIGQGRWEIIRERQQDTNLGKLYRKTKGKGGIAKHYRDELERMQKLRADGFTGRIEFTGYE